MNSFKFIISKALKEQSQTESAVYLQRESKENILKLKDWREDKLSLETEVQYSCQAVLLPQQQADGQSIHSVASHKVLV